MILFVYGTLIRGGVRHSVLAGQGLLGEARTRPLYALFDLGPYPGLVHRPEDGRAIHGELYEIDTGLIPQLDRIEGAPRLYQLEPILIDGFPGEAFSYFYQQGTEGFSLCSEDRWTNKGFTP